MSSASATINVTVASVHTQRAVMPHRAKISAFRGRVGLGLSFATDSIVSPPPSASVAPALMKFVLVASSRYSSMVKWLLSQGLHPKRSSLPNNLRSCWLSLKLLKSNWVVRPLKLKAKTYLEVMK